MRRRWADSLFLVLFWYERIPDFKFGKLADLDRDPSLAWSQTTAIKPG